MAEYNHMDTSHAKIEAMHEQSALSQLYLRNQSKMPITDQQRKQEPEPLSGMSYTAEEGVHPTDTSASLLQLRVYCGVTARPCKVKNWRPHQATV